MSKATLQLEIGKVTEENCQGIAEDIARLVIHEFPDVDVHIEDVQSEVDRIE